MNVESLKSNLPCGTGGVSVNDHGEIFVADFGAILSDAETMGTKVLKLGVDGRVTVFATGLKGASGNEFDSNGNLFQSNIRGNSISRINETGEVCEFASEGILAPVGIVIDENDDLLIANCNGNSIQKVSADGRSTQYAESPLFDGPNGLTLDEQGILYVANFENGDVLRVDREGAVIRLATIPGNNNGHITYLDGELLVVGRSAHQVFRVTLDGTVSVFAGSGNKGKKDGPLLSAEFCFPNDIAVSHDRSCFYVNDISDTSTDGMKLGPTTLRRIGMPAK